ASVTLELTSLNSCLLGLAIDQLIFGPLSDSLGLERPLLVALPLFSGASLLFALAPNITVLVGARFLQGFIAPAGVVISRAVVRDVFSGRALTKFYALLMVINAVAPMVAPMAGGAILSFEGTSWKSIFIFLSLKIGRAHV